VYQQQLNAITQPLLKEETRQNLSNRKLISNTFYNILGKGFPLLAGLISIPILIHGLGVERYGILTLTLVVIGYFGIFDLGIGRATTKFVAEYLILNQLEELRSLVWTSLFSLWGLGLLGAIAAYYASPMIVRSP
jgi:O-antigen/teichoic acid export membrane protein